MDKTPEHCLPSMGTQLLVGGLNFDGLSPCVELDYRGHRLVSRDRVVFTLDLFHSQQLPNGGYFSTALFRLRICERCRLQLFLSAIQRRRIDTEHRCGFINCPGVSDHLPDVFVFDFFERDPAADAKLRPDLNYFSQIVSANLISASENYRSLDEISQFPQIAGPTVRSHRFKRCHGKAVKLFSCSVGKKFKMPACDRLQVLEPFTQRR